MNFGYAENVKSSSIHLSYGLSGLMNSDKYGYEAKTIQEINIGYNLFNFFSAGIVLSEDNTFPDSIKSENSYFGYGSTIGFCLIDSNRIQPFLNLKYVYSGHILKYQIVNGNNSNKVDVTLQRFSIELGTTIIVFKGFGAELGYNLFLYKSGSSFSDQFENLLGMMIGLVYLINI
jgi:hypothetical protein